MATAFEVPQFLKARTVQGLVRAMLLNNLKHSCRFKYFDISQGSDGSWVVWFYLTIPEGEVINAVKR